MLIISLVYGWRLDLFKEPESFRQSKLFHDILFKFKNDSKKLINSDIFINIILKYTLNIIL